MNTRLVMDKAGRIVLPKPLREELHLEPGDSLELESADERITLRPARGQGPLQNRHGIWVLHTGETLAASVTDDLLRQIREDRDSSNLGAGFVSNSRPVAKPTHRPKPGTTKSKTKTKK
jgi:AbrB family looped-hinge helix DNA binding protein